MKLSIVVPCYNEENNLPLLAEKFASALNRDDVELVMVNNGSTDGSQKVMEQLAETYSFIRIVVVSKNQGYGYGITSGLIECRGEFIGWTHADLQTDPKDCIKALELIEGQENSKRTYIKGLRKGRPLFDSFFTVGMSVFESIYLGHKLYDINAQPNIFHRDLMEHWEDPPHDFSLDLYALYIAQKNQLNLIRMPVVFPERIHGESKWNTGLGSKWKFIKRTVEFSVRLKSSLKN